MTLHQLKVFAMVADLGSFTEAGVTLDLRQPSVTALIQSLERDLKIKLFDRFGNKTRITGAGERLLQHAREILVKADQITEDMDEIRGVKVGKLLVGGSAIAAASFLPVVIQAFKEKNPRVDITLRVQGSESLQKMLLNGDLELAIVARTPNSPLLFHQHYRDEEIVVVAPPNHPLARKSSVPLELLAGERFVVSKKDSQMRDVIEKIFADRGLPFTPSLEIDILFGSREAIKNAVVNGLGIAFISKFYAGSEIKAGRLKVLKVPGLKLKRTIYIAVHQNRKNSPLVQAFIDFLRHYKWQQ